MLILHCSLIDNRFLIWGEQRVNRHEHYGLSPCVSSSISAASSSGIVTASTYSTVTASTSSTDAASTSSTDAASTSSTDAASTSSTDAVSTSSTDAVSTADISSVSEPAEAPLSFQIDDQKSAFLRHPFSSTYSILHEVISSCVDMQQAFESTFAKVAIWLPSTNQAPLPSSSIIFEKETESSGSGLEAWIVDALRLKPSNLIELVLQRSRENLLSPGVLLGKEFSFLYEMIMFASHLVIKQHFLPSIVVEENVYLARWESVLIGDDHTTFSKLTKKLPPVLRAISNHDTQDSTPLASPRLSTQRVLDLFVDSIVRESFENQPNDKGVMKTNRRFVSDGTSIQKKFESVHSCWLAALKGISGVMHYDAKELAEFATELDKWKMPVTSGNAAPFRLCFRLDEPPGRSEPVEPRSSNLFYQQMVDQLNIATSDQWKVSYLLQSLHDKSLLIPADEAWKDTDQVRNAFASYKFNPREFLLQSLGQASRLCPDISNGLIMNDLTGYEIDSAGAIEFLSERAQALQDADFGVIVPSWWKRGRKRLKRKAYVRTPGKLEGEFSLKRIVEFNWQISLGGVTLTYKELQALAELKTPLVNVKGEWIYLDPEDIRLALALLEKESQPATVSNVINVKFGAYSPFGTGSRSNEFDTEVQATGWIGDVLQHLEEPQTIEQRQAPQGLEGELRPYQLRGYSWLSFLHDWGLGACLADDMGLGKTIQTLALVQKARNDQNKRPFLLICPTSLINNWQREASKFTPALPVYVHHGANRRKGKLFYKAVKDQALVISSYALVYRDIEDLRTMPWAGLILDEAQNIKNPFSKQSVAVRDIHSQHRIALTGTPVENNINDLWSIMDFINPGLLGDLKQFRKHFFFPIQANKDADATKRLMKITQPFILRRVKTDKTIISDLPEKQEMRVYCPLTKEQVTLYQATLKDLEKKLAENQEERQALVLRTLTRLKQICNHPLQFLADQTEIAGRSGKLMRLEEIVEEILTAREKVLIFSQYKQMGDLIRRHLEERFGEEILFLHGLVKRQERDDMVQRFQGAGGPAIFLLSLKAGGTGLNLTAANHVIHYDRWWNPAVENQASDRAYRIGQKKMVQIRKFVCAGTLEDKIDNLIVSKSAIAQTVIGSGESWLTELSNDALKEVLSLSKDLVLTDGK